MDDGSSLVIFGELRNDYELQLFVDFEHNVSEQSFGCSKWVDAGHYLRFPGYFSKFGRRVVHVGELHVRRSQ